MNSHREEITLEENVTIERVVEMDRFGRTALYQRMRDLLSGDRLRAFELVNHGLAMIDDVLDSSNHPLNDLAHFQKLFLQSYSNQTALASSASSTSSTSSASSPSSPYEQVIVDLGNTLHQLASARFPRLADRAIGYHTFREVLNYWKWEEKNLQRKGQILDKRTLDELNLGIGSTIASQLLFIIDPPCDPHEFIPLAKSYGRAVKLADNLCDFREDIARGFVNIPHEEIHHIDGITLGCTVGISNRISDGTSVSTSVQRRNKTVYSTEPDKIALSTTYMDKEFKRIKNAFEEASYLLLMARLKRPWWNRGLDEKLWLFGNICNSWLHQAGAFMALETKRSSDTQLKYNIPR